jgi:cbb3-type cytochrome oxidase subunit 3
MRLSDIMAGLDLTIFPQVALVIFLVVFASVITRTLRRSRRAELRQAAMLPLDDGPIQNRSTL